MNWCEMVLKLLLLLAYLILVLTDTLHLSMLCTSINFCTFDILLFIIMINIDIVGGSCFPINDQVSE